MSPVTRALRFKQEASLSRELELAKARYQEAALESYRMAARNLSPVIGHDFHITGWSGRARASYNDWVSGYWDWNEVFRRYRDPDRLEIAVWTKQATLAALALGVTTGKSVDLKFLEGSGLDNCPLSGFRAMIALEVTACYAQLRGKMEIRLVPLNEALRSLYVDVYGFEAVTIKGQEPYFRRVV